MAKNRRSKKFEFVKERVNDTDCDLSLSGLSDVPVREIAHFQTVVHLDLSRNQLTELKHNFCVQLSHLVKLDLSGNNLSCLPEDFGLLRHLRTLDLYNNNLVDLPLSFGDLRSLRHLDLKCNPLNVELANIVGCCLTSKDCKRSAARTINYFINLQWQAIENSEKNKSAENKSAKQMLEDVVVEHVEHKNRKRSKQNGANGDTDNAEGKQQQKSKSHNHKNKQTLKDVCITGIVAKSVHNMAMDQQTLAAMNLAEKCSPSNMLPAPKMETKENKTKHKKAKAKHMRRNYPALRSIFGFLLMLTINIIIIYYFMFHNPELVDTIVELIPPQYRDWIVRKTEMFRLHISDVIMIFRTSPEDY